MGHEPLEWINETSDGVVLRCVIQPRASKTQIECLHGSPPRLRIRVAAPPVDGEANAELLRFLKKTLRVKSSQLRIVRGESSRLKDFIVSGKPYFEVEAELTKLLGANSK